MNDRAVLGSTQQQVAAGGQSGQMLQLGGAAAVCQTGDLSQLTFTNESDLT